MFPALGLLLCSVPGFFVGLYRSSRAKTGGEAFLWTGVATVSLVTVAVGTVLIAVPDFFTPL